MHELTVVENIIHITLTVAEENKLQKVTVVNLDVGEMQHLNEAILKHGFNAAIKGTLLEGAILKLNWLPVKLQCETCSKTFYPEKSKFYCPHCDSENTKLIQGTELNIKNIKGE